LDLIRWGVCPLPRVSMGTFAQAMKKCHHNLSKLDCRVMIRLWTLIFSIPHQDLGTSVLVNFLRHRIDICVHIQSLFVYRKRYPCWRYFNQDYIEIVILAQSKWDQDWDGDQFWPFSSL
jgi:hypothetical protein